MHKQELRDKLMSLKISPQKTEELLKNNTITQRLTEIITNNPKISALHVLMSQHTSDKDISLAITQNLIKNEKQLLKILKDCENLKEIGTFIIKNEMTEEEINKIIESCENKREALKIFNDKAVFNDLKEIVKKIEEDGMKNEVKTVEVVKNEDGFKWLKEGLVTKLHKPGENPQMTAEILRNHLKRTGSKVITRFPPEPNGHLHIGHAKAMAFSFDYARMHGGKTFLRFDDTNPKNEKLEFYESIKEDLKWLGYEPDYITASSQYFEQMIAFAFMLIKDGLAYVCHLPSSEISSLRRGDNVIAGDNVIVDNNVIVNKNYNPFIKKENECLTNGCLHKKNQNIFSKECFLLKDSQKSPFRERSIELNLKIFKEMLKGKWKEGSAVLRLKMEESNNPFMQDLIIYRIINHHHPITGNKYKIYPSYDFALCICDSLEDVTHSFCSKEFQTRQLSYQWVLDKLMIYKPVQWEFSRLNLSDALLSKRKIKILIEKKVVAGFDDPRLFTLKGLRKRGFTPESIKKFVKEVGITYNDSVIDVRLLEQIQREELNRISERIICVVDPLKVVIGEETLFISKSDFKEESDESFLRLTLNQPVGLLNMNKTIKAVRLDTDCLICEFVDEKPLKYIHWIKEFVEVELKLYTKLLSEEETSLVVVKGFIERKVLKDEIGKRYQFIREGYFIKDEEMVFNRILELKGISK